MPYALTAKLSELQKNADKIRNICILAHVDHGKTTLADALVSSNGIISSRLAGQLRYLDSRPDEQERGITMKSSAVSLCFIDQAKTEYLINLIDSPGHVDFSGEVSTAVRLCDGGLVVVDVVEGVQPQTKVVLQQAWQEGITPVLVLNKIDRLIVEMKLSPLDAYFKLTQVLEAVNAVIGELFASGVLAEDDKREKALSVSKDKGEVYDWSTGLEDADDSDLYFSPDRGNVVFASAVDGWGFGLEDFARIYSEKLGFSEKVLMKTLWGDFFVNSKTKKIMKGAQGKGKKPLFVQLILENIWAVYDCAILRRDKAKLEKIVEMLGIKVNQRDLTSNDSHFLMSSICSKWLPLTRSLLSMVVRHVPSPNRLTEDRVEKLMSSHTRFEQLSESTKLLKSDFIKCSPSGPVIVFVSKMFPVPKSQLPENRPKPLTQEEMAKRREMARQRHAEKMTKAAAGIVEEDAGVQLTVNQLSSLNVKSEEEEAKDMTKFVAFARVFSGTLTSGTEVYVLGPKYDPEVTLSAIEKGENVTEDGQTVHESANKFHLMKTTVNHFYLLLGRDLEELKSVPAGNIVGIGGLDDYILKSATLTSELGCSPFVEMTNGGVPIVRVAVEPALSTDMPKLVKGLHLLNQADPNVQVFMTDKGEHVLVTAGEVHLERCIRDLKESYAAGIDVVASAPIVPFRETIVEPPETDMVNEQVGEENKIEKSDDLEEIVTLTTANKMVSLTMTAFPLSEETRKLIEANEDLLKSIGKLAADDIQSLKKRLSESLRSSPHPQLQDATEKILSFGPRRIGPNILVNLSAGKCPNVWGEGDGQKSSGIGDYLLNVINGFQLATFAGPLCDEPLLGVAFVILDFKYDDSISDSGVFGPLSGQIVSVVKEGCKKAFQARPQRLAAAMYTCDILVKAEVLGKLYSVLGKRHGRIVHENMIEGSSTFTVTAHLPVVESFEFAGEIRKQTSGLAQPQLVFSHWETIEVDPFWVPQTAEEILHFGDKADSENQARTYMNDVRKKKGLAIDEKIVEFAEKQRTLTKNK